jgi:predicted RNase H-like HicB family nuclease
LVRTFRQSDEANSLQPLSFFLNQRYSFTVTPDPDGGYFIAYPDLPGCMSQVEEPGKIGPAAEDIRILWIETAYDHGMTIPMPRFGPRSSMPTPDQRESFGGPS